jgi:hypothetical protein
MLLTALALMLILSAAPAQAQQPATSSGADAASPRTDGQEPPPGELPVSLDKIRQQLQSPPTPPLLGLTEKPTFSITIQEKQRFQAIIDQWKFYTGPVVAGGREAYDLQQLIFPPTQYPLMQPYAAFNQGELLTVAIENLVGKYAAGKIAGAIRQAREARTEEEARAAVRRALAEFWAAQGAKPPQ